MAEFKGKRARLTLGMVSATEANAFSANLELLKNCRKHDLPIKPDLAAWINSLSPKHQQQLSSIGLVTSFDLSLTVQGVIDQFLVAYAKRIAPAPAAGKIQQATYDSAVRKLSQFPSFFLKHSVSELEPKRDPQKPDALPVFTDSSEKALKRVESYMREHFARATWSRTHKLMNEVGLWAVRSGTISANPFCLLPSPGEDNQARNHEVPAETIRDAVIQCQCPDTALMLVLGRFAGFRLSSEARKLRWSDVCFDTPSITATGKRDVRRRIPMFADVRSALEAQMEITGGERFVLSVDFLKTSDSNHYKKMLKAIERVTDRYTRLRQNLRSTCENDWYEQGHPQRDVEQWIGHSRKIAQKHYNQDRDSRLAAAVDRMK